MFSGEAITTVQSTYAAHVTKLSHCVIAMLRTTLHCNSITRTAVAFEFHGAGCVTKISYIGLNCLVLVGLGAECGHQWTYNLLAWHGRGVNVELQHEMPINYITRITVGRLFRLTFKCINRSWVPL